MRALLPVLCLLAACSGGGEGNKTAAAPPPAPAPSGPAPETPVTNITPAPGRTPTWLEARAGSGDPKRAPYGDVLDQPVVDKPGR